jgi:hypothetical protein
MKASRETIKMKTSEGKDKVAVLGDSLGAEEYLQHLNTFTRMLVRKKLSDDLTKCTKAVVSEAVAVRKYLKVPNGEKTSEKAERLLLLEPAKQELVTAEVAEAAKVATVYELFRKGLKEDPRLVIPAGILRIPVFSSPVALFSQESQFLFLRNFLGTPSGILSVPGLRT